MKKYRIYSLFLGLLLTLTILTPSPVHATGTPEFTVAAQSAVLLDAVYDEVLFDQNAHTKAYPASTTKVVTALIVLDAIAEGTLTLDQMIDCPPGALENLHANGSTANIKVGEALSVRDLLYCLLLPSANEAGNILAYAVSGDIPTFVQQMNTRAKALGAENSNFMNTHGLHEPNHYTTAYDMAIIFQTALEYDIFRTIISTPRYQTATTSLSESRDFINSNGLISRQYYTSYFYENAIGGKTGSTPEAGKCLVNLSEKGDEVLISVIFGAEVLEFPDGSREQQNFTETVRLTEWGLKNFHRVTLSSDDTPVASLPVTLSQETDEILVLPVGEITRTLPVSIDIDNLDETIVFFNPSVEAPIEKGQILGTLTISHEGTEYGTLDLVALNDVARSDFLYYKEELATFFVEWGMRLLIGAVATLALLITLRILYVRKNRRHNRSRNRSRSGYGGRGRR